MGDGQGLGDGLDVGINRGQVQVVVDVVSFDVDWVQTVQRAQLGVRDVDRVAVRDHLETGLDQSWQSNPVDGTDGDQRTHREL